MKAARFYGAKKPLKIEEVEKPKIGPNEVLIKVKATGICHTDLHFLEGILDPKILGGTLPITLGHETAGDIVEVGENVKDFKVGDRVIIHFFFSCGNCYYCRVGMENLCSNLQGFFGFNIDGGYAEYAKAPANRLIRLPNEISYRDSCVLVCGVGTSYHAVKNVAKVKLGDVIVVNGVGGLGIATFQFAKLSGAKIIAVDVVDEKLKLAKELGADEVINAREQDVASEVKRITGGEGAEAVFEFVGKEKTMKSCYDSLRKRGVLVFIGYTEELFKVSPLSMIIGEYQITAANGSTKQELVEVVKLVQEGKFKPLVTREFSLDQLNEALKMLAGGEILGRAIVEF